MCAITSVLTGKARSKTGSPAWMRRRRRDERRPKMVLTKSFKDLVRRRVADDPACGGALLREGIDIMLTGDLDTGTAIRRDHIKATVGFEKLGEATGVPPKSLIRMFGPRGNPQARNLFSVLVTLRKQAGVQLHVTADGASLIRPCFMMRTLPIISYRLWFVA